MEYTALLVLKKIHFISTINWHAESIHSTIFLENRTNILNSTKSYLSRPYCISKSSDILHVDGKLELSFEF